MFTCHTEHVSLAKDGEAWLLSWSLTAMTWNHRSRCLVIAQYVQWRDISSGDFLSEIVWVGLHCNLRLDSLYKLHCHVAHFDYVAYIMTGTPTWNQHVGSFFPRRVGDGCGRAIMLGNFPSCLDNCMATASYACSRCGFGFVCPPFVSVSFFLSLGEGPIYTVVPSQRAIEPKPTNQFFMEEIVRKSYQLLQLRGTFILRIKICICLS